MAARTAHEGPKSHDQFCACVRQCRLSCSQLSKACRAISWEGHQSVSMSIPSGTEYVQSFKSSLFGGGNSWISDMSDYAKQYKKKSQTAIMWFSSQKTWMGVVAISRTRELRFLEGGVNIRIQSKMVTRISVWSSLNCKLFPGWVYITLYGNNKLLQLSNRARHKNLWLSAFMRYRVQDWRITGPSRWT